MLKHLDLFSGIGGFALGLQATGHYQTQAFCENDPWARKVLAKNFPGIPIYPDIRTMHHDGPVDIVTGGYPCQPFSTAGARRGEMDHRHLWPEMERIIHETRPTWVIGENVAGHISLGLDKVLSDLEGQGYSTQAFIIPACAVNACHRRDRVWIVAHANSSRQQGQGELVKSLDPAQTEPRQANQSLDALGWPTEPAVRGTNDGVSQGLDRLRGLGNAVVPQVVEMIGKAIYDTHTTQPETT